jgi:predicted protein tyrosine phosphatase
LLNVLFICSRNVLRSPTAEAIFRDYPGIDVASAGLTRDAVEPVTAELLRWTQLIFVMERRHRERLSRSFRSQLNGQRIICLDIPDNYDFMAADLVVLLKRKVTPHLPSAPLVR